MKIIFALEDADHVFEISKAEAVDFAETLLSAIQDQDTVTIDLEDENALGVE